MWVWTQDLLSKDQPTEIRHLEFAFLIALVRGQHDRLGILRAHFFRVVKQYDHPEDIMPRFELLQALTDNGKDSLYFEEEVGSFLLSWLPNITGTAKTLDYLGLLVNVIKFNASYVDEETTSSLVQSVLFLTIYFAIVENLFLGAFVYFVVAQTTNKLCTPVCNF